MITLTRLLEIFDKLGTEYEVKHRKGDYSDRRGEAGRSIYTAHHNGNQVSKVVLHKDKKHVQDVEVHPDYRRRGVATAMYKHIETHTGKTLKPSNDRTLQGKDFWKGKTS